LTTSKLPDSFPRGYIEARLSRSEFAITDTELKLIAAAAIIGLSRIPKNG
jgi:hypothetical protein